MASIGGGMAGLMDLSGSRARVKLGNVEDDAAALRRDWEAVGNDLWAVMEEAGLKRDNTGPSSVD
jgi:hypothetical protein